MRTQYDAAQIQAKILESMPVGKWMTLAEIETACGLGHVYTNSGVNRLHDAKKLERKMRPSVVTTYCKKA